MNEWRITHCVWSAREWLHHLSTFICWLKNHTWPIIYTITRVQHAPFHHISFAVSFYCVRSSYLVNVLSTFTLLLHLFIWLFIILCFYSSHWTAYNGFGLQWDHWPYFISHNWLVKSYLDFKNICNWPEASLSCCKNLCWTWSERLAVKIHIDTNSVHMSATPTMDWSQLRKHSKEIP